MKFLSSNSLKLGSKSFANYASYLLILIDINVLLFLELMKTHCVSTIIIVNLQISKQQKAM